jgi:CheY-like chemotaxis protein
VWNLLSNAIKFTPKGGRVQVTLNRTNSHLQLQISDTGEGIKPEFLPEVFDRFRQIEQGTARRHGGLGLGLSIVKQLVELHGGTVAAVSPGEGQGSTFTVTLPVQIVHQSDADAEATNVGHYAEIDHPPLNLRGVRVLIVDDERDARVLLERLLGEHGAEVTAAADVDAALKILETNHPDILLSDIGMPDKDGYDLIRAVRSLPNEKVANVPAAALTAFARSQDRTRALMAGFQAHVTKPVEPAELVAVVASLTGRTGRQLRADTDGAAAGRS